jgi:hypothetical protein
MCARKKGKEGRRKKGEGWEKKEKGRRRTVTEKSVESSDIALLRQLRRRSRKTINARVNAVLRRKVSPVLGNIEAGVVGGRGSRGRRGLGDL